MSDETPKKARKQNRRDFGSVILRGKVWYARWVELGRIRLKAIGETKTLAERFLATKRSQLDRAEALGIRPVQTILFEDLLKEFPSLYAGQKSTPTILREQSYLRSVALRYFGGMKVEDIRQEDIERFLTDRIERGNLSGSTRNRLLSILSAMFRRAVRHNYLRENPCKGIPRVKEPLKEPPFLTTEDQEKLIGLFDGVLRNAVRLTLDTGLRLGELLRLDWQDVDLKGRTLTVRTSKNKKPRTIPFGTWGFEALTSQLVLRGDYPMKVTDPVFAAITTYTKRTGEADFTGIVRKLWNEKRREAGFPTLRWHDLRHLFATSAARAGVPLGDLMKLLGHSSLVMVLRYSGHSPANFKEETRQRIEKYRRGEGGEGHVEEPKAAVRA